LLSVARERPLDPLTLDVLRHVDHISQEFGLDYFVVGATARDVLLNGVFGLDTGRRTDDLDLGVAVEGWPQFEAIKGRLIETGSFVPAESSAQRLYYRATTRGTGYPLDIIPFGGVEQPLHQIAWPPDRSIVMNVAGYEEARACAVPMDVDSGFVVRVASLPGLAILKLVAWADRGVSDPRDAIDLATLLRQYGGAGNTDRLYDSEIAVLEVANYDFELAGARLLGMDATRIAAPRTRAQVHSILDDAGRLDRLIRDVARGLAAEDPIAIAGGLLAQFNAGFREAQPDATPD
jgi:predicted nucleotidyltransferase